MDFRAFIEENWETIKTVVEKIYFYIRDLLIAKDAE